MQAHSKWYKLTMQDIASLPKLIVVMGSNSLDGEILRVMRRDYKRGVVWVIREGTIYKEKSENLDLKPGQPYA